MVRNFRSPLLQLLESGGIDLCFANEDEATELLRWLSFGWNCNMLNCSPSFDEIKLTLLILEEKCFTFLLPLGTNLADVLFSIFLFWEPKL